MFSDIAIFTDLDGTFFNSHRVVSPENREAAAYFVAHGGTLGISTARALKNTRRILQDVPVNGWYILLNGALTYNGSTGEQSVDIQMDHDDVTKVIAWMQETYPMVNTRLYTDQKMYYLTDPKYADQRVLYQYPDLRTSSLSDAAEESWLRILMTGPRDLLDEVRDFFLRNNLSKTVSYVYTEPEALEFIPRGVNKGRSLRMLRKLPELSAKKIIAVGDYDNDMELLKSADVGIAVGNAVPALKEIADYVTVNNDEHAFVDIVNRILPQYIHNGYSV